jgi:glycosyltransferase involved in cell wall biosynthesis
MWALARHLCARADVTIALATGVPGASGKPLRDGGLTHYPIPQRGSQHWLAHTKADVDHALEAIRDFRPDIIHVHGTERFHGLIRERVEPSLPVVVSIQGLLTRYHPFWLADMTLAEKLATVRARDFLRRSGPLFERRLYRKAIRREETVLTMNRYFIGRTEWDRSWVLAYNPSARYYVCNEVLRDPFYAEQWDIDRVRRNTVLFTSAQNPLKGVYTLLDAMTILRKWGVPVMLELAGDWSPRSDLGRPVAQRILTMGLAGNVKFLGPLDAAALARQMSTSHLFVSPSHIDNSPNSVMEAMCVGLPCIASYVGGVPTLLDGGRLGIAVPPRDPAMLASAIRRLLSDDAMAVSLSRCAREVAHGRYNPAAITERQMQIYSEIIEDAKCASLKS